MSDLKALVGENLLSKGDSEEIQTDTLKTKKYIGLYFSAHWCPPCRGFTPKLTEWYNALQEKKEISLEIIFVSFDRDEPSFNEYYATMPFLSIPFGQEKNIQQELGNKFSVSGIPSLVILNQEDNCAVVTTNGRDMVANNSQNEVLK